MFLASGFAIIYVPSHKAGQKGNENGKNDTFEEERHGHGSLPPDVPG
jgi:hypothetical protein